MSLALPLGVLSPALSWAGRADPLLRGLLTAEGTHQTGEPSESRAHRSLPILIPIKGPLVAWQLPVLAYGRWGPLGSGFAGTKNRTGRGAESGDLGRG